MTENTIKYYLWRAMKKYFFLFSFFSFSILAFAQSNNSFNISKINVSGTVILDSLWKYNAGDDTAWAQTGFNDNAWKSSFTKTIDLSKNNFNGIIWFRLHVSVPPNLRHKPLAIVLGQNGASEFYVDGKFIHSFGHPDKEKSKEIKYTSNGIPFIFEFEDGDHHVIAVRYSNHLVSQANQEVKVGSNTSKIFTVELKETENAIVSVVEQTLIFSILTTFLATFFITLSFVHLLLFLFYRNQKSNLYYSIFISLFALFFLIPLFILNTSNPDNQAKLTSLFIFILPTFFTALLGFIYSLFYTSVPKRFKIISIILLVLLISKALLGDNVGILIFIFVCVITIFSAVEVIKAIYKTKKGAWVVGTATISFLLLIIALLLKNALGFGTGIYISKFDLNGILLFGLLLLVIMSIPISMSVYLAREFAGTNKNLEKKLIEVETLSEKTIEQEKEKQKILETQKDVLEIQVRERTSEIVEQKKVIEEKNKDITDSINYAKRIQDAILPAKELKYRIFPNAFVLFKPKDIVSGDFYWFAEKNGKRLIASCDCTGHGVPGALMSMIGNNILNQIVNETGITSPDKILNLLNREVRKALKQGEQTASKDGMDVAIICFINETEIEYAGAQRPLWMIRNNSFEEIKGDKFSIGGLQTEAEKEFIKHTIALSKNDCIYIFSDGFVDQFGGAQGKKFMSKQFKNLLLANYNKPILEQETVLNNTIENWKDVREQIDDILVIGIKIE
jgi:serine phosphatase RsbU (regulator of sigma subunit)